MLYLHMSRPRRYTLQLLFFVCDTADVTPLAVTSSVTRLWWGCWIWHVYLYRKMFCFFIFFFWHPLLVRPATKRPFCLKAKNRLGRSAASALPHYYYTSYIIVLIFLTQVLLLVYMPATLCSTKFVCPVLLCIHILYHQSACFPSILLLLLILVPYYHVHTSYKYSYQYFFNTIIPVS